MPLRNRGAPNSSAATSKMVESDPNSPRRPLLGANRDTQDATSAPAIKSNTTTTQTGGEDKLAMENLSKTSQWIVLAVASGGCAAFNGVFAKL